MVGIPTGDSLSRSQRLVRGMLLTGLGGCIFYIYVLDPILTQTAIVKGEIQRLSQEIHHHSSQLLNRDQLGSNIRDLEKRLYGDSPDFRQKPGGDGLRTQVAGIARALHLEMTFWEPKHMVQNSPDGLNQISIRIQVQGGYHQVSRLFSRLLHLPDVVEIAQFTIAVTDAYAPEMTIQTTIVLTILAPYKQIIDRSLHQGPKDDGQGHRIGIPSY